MTAKPDVPIGVQFEVEVPGTPQQVWDAIATANGMSSWFGPSDVEERQGGEVCFHMGPDMDAKGIITTWDPPRLLVYSEPDWATLAGKPGEAVTPLVSEFLVEARSGGTCVVKVASSAFGTGASWENEFLADMEKHWKPFFDQLRLYLTHFPGQRVTSMEVTAELPGKPDPVWAAVRQGLGDPTPGQTIDIGGVPAVVEQVAEVRIVARLTGDVPGYVGLYVFGKDETTSVAGIAGYLFSDDAESFVRREQPRWKTWLEGLVARAG